MHKFAGALLLLPALCAAAQRAEFTAAGDFSEAAIVRGVKADKAQCDRIANAVWAVTADAGAECLKYWTAGDRKSVV